METKEFLKQHGACKDGAKWAKSISGDMSDVWNAMIKQGKHDWLIWTATRPDVFPVSVLRKLACRFIRETPLSDGRKAWDLLNDERSRRAVEVAELYADGKATYEELQAAYAAAYAAADDAAYAAYAARAARAAARDATFAAFAAARDAVAFGSLAARDDAAGVAAAFGSLAARDAAARAADAARDAAYDAARAAAEAAQAQMIAEMGNPFK